MKLDRRRADRRSSDRMLPQSHCHHDGTERRRGRGRRLKTRNPIYVWYQSNKKEIPLYLFLLAICILVAAIINFKDDVSNSLYNEHITNSSKYSETENIFANKKAEENRRLLERNQLENELW